MSLFRLSTPISRLSRQFCTTPKPPPTTTPTRPQPPSSETPKQLNPPHADKPDDELTLLYNATLEQVLTHGWTPEAIQAAAQTLGWSPAARAMFPRGPVDVVDEFVRRCDTNLAAQLAQQGNAPKGLHEIPSSEKATFAIRTRLEMLDPFHAHWPAALKLRALPQNSKTTLRDSALLADEIAHYAGFTTPDASWYADRAVFGLAYHATELYWLTDHSQGREETWRFLERRLRDSHELRDGFTSAYTNFMTLSDATIGSLSSLFKSTRRSY